LQSFIYGGAGAPKYSAQEPRIAERTTGDRNSEKLTKFLIHYFVRVVDIYSKERKI